MKKLIILLIFNCLIYSSWAKEVSINFTHLTLQGHEDTMTGHLIATKFMINADGDHVVIDDSHGVYDSFLEHRDNRIFFKSDNFLLSTPFEMSGTSNLNLEMTNGQFLSTSALFRFNTQSVFLKSLSLQNVQFETQPLLLESNDKVSHLLVRTQINIENLSAPNQKMRLFDENKSLVEIDDLSKMELKIDQSRFQFKGKVKIFTNISFKVEGTTQKREDGILVNIAKASIAGIVPAKSLVFFLLNNVLEKDIVEINDDQILIKM